MIVLSAEMLPPDWSQMPPDLGKALTTSRAAVQQELADESTAGSLETVPGVGHDIQGRSHQR